LLALFRFPRPLAELNGPPTPNEKNTALDSQACDLVSLFVSLFRTVGPMTRRSVARLNYFSSILFGTFYSPSMRFPPVPPLSPYLPSPGRLLPLCGHSPSGFPGQNHRSSHRFLRGLSMAHDAPPLVFPPFFLFFFCSPCTILPWFFCFYLRGLVVLLFFVCCHNNVVLFLCPPLHVSF